jgi:hypothetical protein
MGLEFEAQVLDDWCMVLMPVVYVLFNAAVFVPRVWRRWRAGARPAAGAGAVDTNGFDKVDGGLVYEAWADTARIDYGSCADVIIGSRVVPVRSPSSATLMDTDGDGVYDAVDIDGDGQADAALVKMKFGGGEGCGGGGGGGEGVGGGGEGGGGSRDMSETAVLSSFFEVGAGAGAGTRARTVPSPVGARVSV